MKGKSLVFIAADGERQSVRLASSALASGADGTIYHLDGLNTSAVAKLYHAETLNPERLVKLQAMLNNMPTLPATQSAGRPDVQLAWPLGLLYERNGEQG